MSGLGAFLARLQHPEYGTCYTCGYPWNLVEEHPVNYTPFSAIFAMCEPCWWASGLDKRLEAHRWTVLRVWDQPAMWPQIALAVCAATVAELDYSPAPEGSVPLQRHGGADQL